MLDIIVLILFELGVIPTDIRLVKLDSFPGSIIVNTAPIADKNNDKINNTL